MSEGVFLLQIKENLMKMMMMTIDGTNNTNIMDKHTQTNWNMDKQPDRQIYKKSDISKWSLGHGGALVESIPFDRMVVGSGFESRSSRHVGTLGKSLTRLPVALRPETPAQHPCCVGSAFE